MTEKNSIKVHMAIEAYCPECGRAMQTWCPQGMYIMCVTLKCKLYQKKFELPIIEVKEKTE